MEIELFIWKPYLWTFDFFIPGIPLQIEFEFPTYHRHHTYGHFTSSFQGFLCKWSCRAAGHSDGFCDEVNPKICSSLENLTAE